MAIVIELSPVADQYAEQDFWFPIDVISPEMARDASGRTEWLIAQPPRGFKHPWNIKVHLLFDWVYALTVHPAVLNAFQAVISPDVLLQAAENFANPAHGIKQLNWHQDASYWGFDPFEPCTAWIALTDVFTENGCMRFMPKTHLKQKMPRNETFASDSNLTHGQEIALDIDETKSPRSSSKAATGRSRRQGPALFAKKSKPCGNRSLTATATRRKFASAIPSASTIRPVGASVPPALAPEMRPCSRPTCAFSSNPACVSKISAPPFPNRPSLRRRMASVCAAVPANWRSS